MRVSAREEFPYVLGIFLVSPRNKDIGSNYVAFDEMKLIIARQACNMNNEY